MNMIIKGVRVDISTQTISRFLHGLDFQLPTNTVEMDYPMDEMQKVKTKQNNLEDKLTHFLWMDDIISMA